MTASPTLRERAAVRALEGLGKQLWGFRPNLMQDIVDQRGAANAVGWFARNMPRYERTMQRWGPIRTHLVATMISVLGDCTYCTLGHAEAFQLHYLDRYGSLFPIDESRIVQLRNVDRTQAMSKLRSALDATSLSSEFDVLERLCELLDDPERAETDDDGRLVHLIEMFAMLNACGVAADTTPDAAHDPINKNTSLRDRYRSMRDAEAS